jgi:4-hydroxy-tetrahydrodipicolinate synthase
MPSFFRLEGTYTALVTPFTKDDASPIAPPIDWAAYEALLRSQVEGGVDGVVPCGTTGESPALSPAEQTDLIRRAVKEAGGRVRVMPGTGTSATASTIERSREAERAGADAVMVVVPYYNKPTQEGLYRHFVAVAASVGCPVVVYNIPGRSVVDLLPDTLARICDVAKNVVGIKEATGNVLRGQELARRFGDRLAVMAGDDLLTVPMMAGGAKGIISVTSNLLPKDVARMTHLASEGLFIEARAMHLALLPVHEAMFLEANPAPVKAALALEGKMQDVVRGPLAPVTEATRQKIKDTLVAYARRTE